MHFKINTFWHSFVFIPQAVTPVVQVEVDGPHGSGLTLLPCSSCQ